MKKLEDYKGQKIAVHFPPFEDGFGGRYSEKQTAVKDGYTILPATDFLEEEFIYGQEYEFSDDEDFRIKTIAIYGCINPIK